MASARHEKTGALEYECMKVRIKKHKDSPTAFSSSSHFCLRESCAATCLHTRQQSVTLCILKTQHTTKKYLHNLGALIRDHACVCAYTYTQTRINVVLHMV